MMMITRRAFLISAALALFTPLVSCERILAPEELDEITQKKTKYTMGFVLLGKSSEDNNEENNNIVNQIKNQFPNVFYHATQGLAKIVCSEQTLFLEDEDKPLGYDSIHEATNHILNQYNHLDFVTIIPTHDARAENYSMHYHGRQNNVNGIGQGIFNHNDNKDIPLQGIIGLANHLNTYIEDENYGTESLEQTYNGLLHELGHRWGVYVGDNFDGTENEALGLKQQGIHFYRGLQSPHEGTTPMGSDNWILNEDDETYFRTFGMPMMYHPFQLYFMGLINEDNFDFNQKFSVFNAGGWTSGTEFDPTKATPYKEISINDIIEVEGPREVA